ncbi:MAG: hypothetical protein MHPSP_003629, partial [Paramarteilia canceri]
MTDQVLVESLTALNILANQYKEQESFEKNDDEGKTMRVDRTILVTKRPESYDKFQNWKKFGKAAKCDSKISKIDVPFVLVNLSKRQ